MMKNTQDNIYTQIESIALKSSNDDIFIIGKGPSIDEINSVGVFPGIVINVNDSEKIVRGDIGIFSENWVRHSLKTVGFNCQFYLAGKSLPEGVNHAVLPNVPIDIDEDELMTFRLELENFYDEKFVLLNALKVAVLIGKQRNIKPNVYLLGFDFSTEKGEISKHIEYDYAIENQSIRSLTVHSQEFEFLQFCQFFKYKPHINLIHVGHRDFSQYSPQEFLNKYWQKPLLKDEVKLKVSVENRVLIVAELTNNHLGDTKRLIEMIERAKDSGADLIKLQKREVDTFYTTEKLNSYYWSPFGKTLGEYRKGVELDERKLELVAQKCSELDIDWFCSVLDYPSFQLIKNFHPNLIKLPSTISNHTRFHQQVAHEYMGPIVVSTGFTSKDYEDYVLKTFKHNRSIYLLHCVSSYPTSFQDCNVSVVGHYHELSKRFPTIIPGYSSHDLGSMASIIAVASGARMIEKHVKLGDVDWVHFDKVAVDLKTDEFKRFVDDVRQAELILGSAEKRILASEHHKYDVVSK